MERPLTKYITPGSIAYNLEDYKKVGGYAGLKKAMKNMTPAEVTSLVKGSNLLGRGGAGFSNRCKMESRSDGWG